MAHIDNFLAKMAERGAQRAELLNDQAGRITVGGQYKTGPSISTSQLEKAVEEVAPSHLRSRVAEEGEFSFDYESPHGIFEFDINRINGMLQILIEPAATTVMNATQPSDISTSALTSNLPITAAQVDMQPCPFCGQAIKAEATKCRFCKQWLHSVGMSPSTTDADSRLSDSVAIKTDSSLQGRMRGAGWLLAVVVLFFVTIRLLNPSGHTPASVSSPVPASVPTQQALVGEQFPQTCVRVLTSEELDNLSLEKLQYVINEMYARHGYDFPGSKGDQFRQYDWYHPVSGRTQAETEQNFNSFEEANKRLLIQKREELRSVSSIE